MPKEDAAIMIGTIASPSSPSVRFTALPAADDHESAEGNEEPAEIEIQSLKNGNVRLEENGALPAFMMTNSRRTGNQEFEQKPRLAAENPLSLCLVTFR
jgi:hypothetical protein